MTRKSRREIENELDDLDETDGTADPMDVVCRLSRRDGVSLLDAWNHVADRDDIGDPEPLADFTD